jgi:hypothetical protein
MDRSLSTTYMISTITHILIYDTANYSNFNAGAMTVKEIKYILIKPSCTDFH